MSGVGISRAVMRAHSKSFSLAARLLPRSCRDAAMVVYAWCRRADDAVDEVAPHQARRSLFRLEQELEGIYADIPQRDPVLEAFRLVVRDAGIPRQYPEELLLGMRMDVEGVRYVTLQDLLLYCHRVAGTVGLMMCHVMGVTNRAALKHAAHLGIAMQLTNICRDVTQDWSRRRVYLPQALWFAESQAGRAGPALVVSEGGPIEACIDKRSLSRVVGLLLAEADRFYASADRGLRHLSPRCRWAVLVARLVYCRIGDVLRARGCDVTRGRAHVPGFAKLWLVLCGLFKVVAAVPGRIRVRRESSRPLPVMRYPADVLPL